MSFLIEGNNGLDNKIKHVMPCFLDCLGLNGGDSCQSEIGEWVGTVPVPWPPPCAECPPPEQLAPGHILVKIFISLLFSVAFSFQLHFPSTWCRESCLSLAPPNNFGLPALQGILTATINSVNEKLQIKGITFLFSHSLWGKL